MKLSYKWLKNYVDLPENLTMKKLSYDLTMRTVEVESATDPAKKYENIVVGIIKEVKPHPNADKLSLLKVDIGSEDVQIVCGGENLVKGHAVICALPGASVIWHGKGEPQIIEESELRGEESYGMVCGAEEVGLGDLFPPQSEREIVDLSLEMPDADLKAGQSVSQLLDLDDFIIEIENKSLTNRPDLWCHYGIARELSAIYGGKLKDLPKFEKIQSLKAFPIKIEDPDLCHRFIAGHYTGVDSRKAPIWMRIALMKVGIRSINALVDWTNYVMMAVGNPCHAYDRDHIEGAIRVRSAGQGEDLTILDGTELKLNEKDIVIADDKKALGLAGCMGGAKDSISETTKEAVLEIANFNPHAIRKTSQRYDIRTEASQRNEKGLDTQRAQQAFAFADKLLKEIFPDAQLLAFSDLDQNPTENEKVNVSLNWLNKRLGKETDLEEVEKLLKPLGFITEAEVKGNDTLLTITVPSWRSTGDVSLPDDILEEVARMIGYENFDLLAPTVTLTKAVNQRDVRLERNIAEYLSFSCGFYEIKTYPWVRDDYIEASGDDQGEMLSLAQPPAPDRGKLRSSLVPGLLESIVNNARFFEDFRIFEIGQVYKKGRMMPSEEKEVLPLQKKQLAGAVVGKDAESLFYDAKGLIESLASSVQTDELIFKLEESPEWADSKAWLNIIYHGEKIGNLGLLSNKVKHDIDLKYLNACIFTLDIGKLKAHDSRTNTYQALPQYPHVKQDLSVILDKDVNWQDVEDRLKSLVYSLEFVDEYHGEQIPEGKKSLTLRVELASDRGTLTTAQINEEMKKIRLSLEALGARDRSV